jgi:CBS domain-containing protein
MARIREVMRPDPLVLSPDLSMSDALDAMRSRGVDYAVLVHEEEVTDPDQVVAIVTAEDLVVSPGTDPEQTNIGIVASTRLTTATPDDDVDVLRGAMDERHIRHLPVVDDGHPIGVVVRADLDDVASPRR